MGLLNLGRFELHRSYTCSTTGVIGRRVSDLLVAGLDPCLSFPHLFNRRS